MTGLNHKKLKIALLSLADINNYGDVFFPYVCRAELQKRIPEAEFEIITNVRYDSGLYVTMAYEKEKMTQYDAIVYCGGELVSPYDNDMLRETYRDSFGLCDYTGVPSDIAHGWLDMKEPFKAWFSIGAHPVLFDYPNEVEAALENLDYLSVRGTISKKVLEKGFALHNNNIRVMPDLGWLFPRYIDTERMIDIPSICGVREGGAYVCFEAVDDCDINTYIPEIASSLKEFQAKTGVKVLLFPIIQSKKEEWSEGMILRKIYDAAGGALTLIPEGLNILETGAVLKHAKFFLGSSLHGAVTALAYGNPAVNIRGSMHTKLQDVHAARCRSACFATGWDVVSGVLFRLNNEAENKDDHKYAVMYAEYMRYRLDKEFDGLAARIQQYVNNQ